MDPIERYLVPIITFILGLLTFHISARKSRVDEVRSKQQGELDEANTVQTWAQSNQIAANQILQLTAALAAEQQLRRGLESKLRIFESRLDQQSLRIRVLEQQIVKMGGVPIPDCEPPESSE